MSGLPVTRTKNGSYVVGRFEVFPYVLSYLVEKEERWPDPKAVRFHARVILLSPLWPVVVAVAVPCFLWKLVREALGSAPGATGDDG